MLRWVAMAFVLVGGVVPARAERSAIRCDNLSTAELAIDGMLDDWAKPVLARAGASPDGAIDLRCSWDGTALAIALDIQDDRLVRVRSGRAHEDRLAITVRAGGVANRASTRISVRPGNAIAKAAIVKPARVALADSLQPEGFSIETRIPGSAIAGLSASTPSLELVVVFVDSDRATGGDDTEIELATTIELSDRADLFADFLRSAKLRRTDLRLDTMAELDPDRRGLERVVAGGTVIGVLTDRYGFVSLPVARPADVQRVELIPLGNRGQQVVAAVVRQVGNGGARELLMLWTVWSGQLEPLGSLEVRKELGPGVLEAGWRIVKSKRGPELWVEPKRARGLSAETWNEEPATDVDAIVLPWDAKRSGVAYTMTGASLLRRDLPPKKRR